jgi:hypothetical protein
MFDSIGNLLGSAKDRALEASTRAFLNKTIADFGSVTALTVDTRLRKASLTAELKGESVPISVQIGSYDLVEQNGRMCIEVQEISASREWLSVAIRQYLVGRLIPLPPGVVPFLK